MKVLEQTIEMRGIGELTIATQLKRQGNICLYLRDDDAYEVFIVQTEKAKEIKGVKFEAREVYPKNEDFGSTAWCYYGREDLAIAKFDELVKKGQFHKMLDASNNQVIKMLD